MKDYIVFYAGLVYGTYPWDELKNKLIELPDGIYLYDPTDRWGSKWYLKDLTPMLIEDVPKELRATVLLLT